MVNFFFFFLPPFVCLKCLNYGFTFACSFSWVWYSRLAVIPLHHFEANTPLSSDVLSVTRSFCQPNHQSFVDNLLFSLISFWEFLLILDALQVQVLSCGFSFTYGAVLVWGLISSILGNSQLLCFSPISILLFHLFFFFGDSCTFRMTLGTYLLHLLVFLISPGCFGDGRLWGERVILFSQPSSSLRGVGKHAWG